MSTTRRDLLDFAIRAAAPPGAAEFFSTWLTAAQVHQHASSGSSEAPPEPPLLRDYKPKFFAPENFEALQAFSEILIPRMKRRALARRIARITSISFFNPQKACRYIRSNGATLCLS
jgi:hypothetical protein